MWGLLLNYWENKHEGESTGCKNLKLCCGLVSEGVDDVSMENNFLLNLLFLTNKNVFC